MVFGGNALTQILYGRDPRRGGGRDGLRRRHRRPVLINTVVTVFAGRAPDPGGVGVSEAGLTAGLVAARHAGAGRADRAPCSTA